MVDAEDNEARTIVRIYSFHAEERLPPTSDGHALGRILSHEEPSLEDITAPWRRFFEPQDLEQSDSDPLTAVLSVEAARLREQWVDFQKKCPKEDQIDIKNSEPTMNGLVKMVSQVGNIWQAKRETGKTGKAMERFHRFCGTLDAHSSMLEIIPKGDKYVSLFSGTIASIIKASVNHEHIAEELSLALCTISEHIEECERELKLFNTEAMQRAVIDLYAHIFLFLTDTMEWYTKKRRRRTLDSFNEKFYHTFESEIQNIKSKSKAILRKTIQNIAAEQRVARLTIEETRRDFRMGLEGVRLEHAETRRQREMEARELRETKQSVNRLVGELQKLLTYAAMSHRSSEVSSLSSSLSLSRELSNPETLLLMGRPHAGNVTMTREELLLNSAHLEDFFHRDRVRLSSDLFSPVRADPSALSRLVEWAQSTDQQLLSIAGPNFEDDEFNNPMTMLAAKFTHLSAGSDVFVVSYFCQLRRGQQLRDGNTMEMQGLIELVYGLLRQMIEITPVDIDCAHDFSKARFEQLDGSADSWEDAMALFDDIRGLLPSRVFCVIDGYQWLDDKSTAEYLTQFVGLLRGERLKVLLTTTGQSRCLLGCLSRPELLILDRPRSWSSAAASQWEFEEAALELV